MKSNMEILLKNLLRSTSAWNIYKYCDDGKKRRKIIGGYFGVAVLYIMLMAFCVVLCIGFGAVGLVTAIPEMCAVLAVFMELIFTLFKTNGYLFGFKEYDMVMSLPVRASTVAGTRFLYMYIKNFSWVISISVAMLIGYEVYTPFSLVTVITWLILTLFLPMIPMVVAALIGAVIAGFSTGFRHKQLIQTIFTFIFLILCFSLRFIIEGVIRSNGVNKIMVGMSDFSGKLSKYYPPVAWFKKALAGEDVLINSILFIGVSVLVFALFCFVVGKYYRLINSKLKSSVVRKKYSLHNRKMRSVYKTVVFKELKRFLGSTVYITNAGFGQLLCLIAIIASLFVDLRAFVDMMQLKDINKIKELFSAVPLILYFFLGMGATTACSLSLEGKNYWIVQSLPIDKKTLLKGKMLFNVYLTVPFMIAGCLTVGFKLAVGILPILTATVFGVCLCLFSTAFGMRCGVKHAKFDWENEVEVIKQGTAMSVYILPNMFGTLLFGCALVILSMIFNIYAVLIPASIIVLLLALWSYEATFKYAGKLL